MLDTV